MSSTLDAWKVPVRQGDNPEKLSLSFIASHFFATVLAPLIIVFLTMIVALQFLIPKVTLGDALDKVHKTGQVTDPIDALIFLERARESTMNFGGFMLKFFGISAVLGALMLAFNILLPRLMPSYVFYWGDMIAYYNRRVSFLRIIWITIILGAAASIIGGLVLNYFMR